MRDTAGSKHQRQGKRRDRHRNRSLCMKAKPADATHKRHRLDAQDTPTTPSDPGRHGQAMLHLGRDVSRKGCTSLAEALQPISPSRSDETVKQAWERYRKYDAMLKRHLTKLAVGPTKRNANVDLTEDDQEAIFPAVNETDIFASAASPRARRKFRRQLYRLIRRRIRRPLRAGDMVAFLVTIFLGRFNARTHEFDADARELSDAVRNLFCRDRQLHYVGMIEFAMLRFDERTKGHGRFDVVCPHAHLIVWMPKAEAKGFKKKLARRGKNLRGAIDGGPIAHAKRIKRRSVDLARATFYLCKSSCKGYRYSDGEWRSGEKLFAAGYLDQFRILNAYTLPQLLLTKGDGVEIRRELFGASRGDRDA